MSFLESLPNHLKDRFLSPLSSSFMISWVIWNYKFLLVVFSDMKPYVKFSYISGQVYPDILHAIGYGVLGPLVTSVLYVTVYPFINHKIMDLVYWHGRRLEAQRQKNHEETPLSEETAKALRKSLNAQINAIESELDAKTEQVRSLKAKEAGFEDKLHDAQTEREIALSEVVSLRSQLSSFESIKAEHSREVVILKKNIDILTQRLEESSLRIENIKSSQLASEVERDKVHEAEIQTLANDVRVYRDRLNLSVLEAKFYYDQAAGLVEQSNSLKKEVLSLRGLPGFTSPDFALSKFDESYYKTKSDESDKVSG